MSAHGRPQAAALKSYFHYGFQLCTLRIHQDSKSLAFHNFCASKEKKKKEKLKSCNVLNCQDTIVIRAMTNNNITFPVLLLLGIMRINSDHGGFGGECKQEKSSLKLEGTIILLFLFQFSLHRHWEIFLKSSFNCYYFGPFHTTFWSLNLVILFFLFCHPFEAM